LWDVRQVTKPRLLGRTLAGSDRRNVKRFVYSVAFSPDGKTLATGGWDGTLRLWDVTTPAHPRPLGMPLKGPGGSIRTVAFDADGEMIAVGSGDGTIWFWNTKTRKAIGDPLPGTEAVDSVVFTPSGEILASAGDDGMLRFWDVATHRPLGQSLHAHKGPIRSIVLSRDASVIASAGDDGTVRVWSGVLWSSLAGLRAHICRLVVGGLTEAEWTAVASDLHYEADCPT
jgi:WD40 repeat protein